MLSALSNGRYLEIAETHRPRCRTKRYFGFGPSTASGHLEVLARNLTFGVSTNQLAAQLPVVTANNVPIPVTNESQNWPFAAAVREVEAVGQVSSSFSLT